MKELIQNLHEEIIPLLKTAKEFRMAVALMNSYILKLLEETLPSDCERKYLVGVNLPTHPDVLERLFILQKETPHLLNAKVYKAKENYHPKVYIIKHQDDTCTTLLGSANATRGGWYSNVEMNSIHCQEKGSELVPWFDKLFAQGIEIDEYFLDKYRKAFDRNKFLERTMRSNIDNVFENGIFPPPLNSSNITPDQFFQTSDFEAYAPSTHTTHDDLTISRRNVVRQRLLDLDKLIFPRFSEFGMDDLHRHPNSKNATGLTHPYMGREVIKDAIWLHYGKSDDELGLYSVKNPREFSNHIRLQVILRHTTQTAFIGIWLYVGKAGGSQKDREFVQGRIDSAGFLTMLNSYLQNLGASYYLDIGGHPIRTNDIQSENSLKLFLIQDQGHGFKTDFKIGRNYHVDHPDISKDKIAEVTLMEFSKLYKIFQMFRHRMPIIKTPEECSESELTSFRKLVMEGGQLAVSEQRLKQNISNCLYLAFQYKGAEVVGISAIKKHTLEEARRKLSKANLFHLLDEDVPRLELGYSVTKPQYRGNGINRTLNDQLLTMTKGEKVFATTGVAEMKTFLSKRSFEKKGQSYPGRKAEIVEYFEKVS